MEHPQKIIVARSGSTLGSFSEQQVRDGLTGGLFRPSDHYWKSGSTSWAKLSQLFPSIGSEPLQPDLTARDSKPKNRNLIGGLLKLSGMIVLTLLLAVLAYSGFEYFSRKSDDEKLEGEVLYAQAVKAAPGLAIAAAKQSEIPAALPYLRSAGDKGNRRAQLDLGMVLGGWGESQGPWTDFEESEKWLIRAAKQGDPAAMQFLISGYSSEKPRYGSNPTLGLTWYFCLPENQRLYSHTELIASGRFDPETVSEAKRRASTFTPKSEYRSEYYKQMAEKGRGDSDKRR